MLGRNGAEAGLAGARELRGDVVAFAAGLCGLEPRCFEVRFQQSDLLLEGIDLVRRGRFDRGGFQLCCIDDSSGLGFSGREASGGGPIIVTGRQRLLEGGDLVARPRHQPLCFLHFGRNGHFGLVPHSQRFSVRALDNAVLGVENGDHHGIYCTAFGALGVGQLLLCFLKPVAKCDRPAFQILKVLFDCTEVLDDLGLVEPFSGSRECCFVDAAVRLWSAHLESIGLTTPALNGCAFSSRPGYIEDATPSVKPTKPSRYSRRSRFSRSTISWYSAILP